MGVSGSGKTTLGKALAQKLAWDFFDADDFHPPGNIAKMTTGFRSAIQTGVHGWLRSTISFYRRSARIAILCWPVRPSRKPIALNFFKAWKAWQTSTLREVTT
jgi:hypothetical protein